MDIFDKKIEGLEKKFNEFEEKNKEQQNEFINLKNQFLKLKEDYEQLVKIVLENKEQINSLFERLNETIKEYKEGDENLKKKIDSLKKYTDDKLLELNTKLELLLNNINGGVNNKKVDLSGLDNFMEKLVTLENRFDEFVNKVNIDEIYSQLKYLNEHKADKLELEQAKEALNNLNKKSQEHQEQIETIIYRLDSLYQQLINLQNEPKTIIKEEKKEKEKNGENKKENIIRKYSIDLDSLDLSKYTLKTDFDSYVQVNKKEIDRIWSEIKRINKQIDEISKLLKDKVDIDDLNESRDFLLNKIEELINDFKNKFADKDETAKNLKYLEDQIKKLYSLIKSSKKQIHTFHEADNWLLAKKPINGFSCAACESYIGELKNDKNKFIAWNKLPVRDPGDKLYRMGNGFSKMLNLLNFDNYGNVSLNPNDSLNSNDSENEDESNDKVPNINVNNANELKQKSKSKNSKTLLKNRFQSASTSLIKDGKENNMKIAPKTQINFFNKEEIKSKYLPRLKKEMSDENFERLKEEKPKITKIFKKSQKKFHIKESS